MRHLSSFQTSAEAALVALLCFPHGSACADSPEPRDEYLLSTPQIEDPFMPLAGIAAAAGHIRIHAAVVSVADPLETHLGRAFDIQVGSLIRAFHAKDFVLDGYAFTWDPKLAGDPKQGIRIPDKGTEVFKQGQRSRPSVLLFRKDEWRNESQARSGTSNASTAQVQYVVLYLVGESPTYGLQPYAFLEAARCAAALNGWNESSDPFQTACSKLFNRFLATGGENKKERTLEIIGPSFSGSMESLALALGNLFEQSPGLAVNVTSPSASVGSNSNVEYWTKSLVPQNLRAEMTYGSLATSLEDQLHMLCNSPALPKGRENKILILAEESTFGGGVSELLKGDKFGDCKERVRVAQFPQNIAAIRAEHSRLNEKANAKLDESLPGGNRLLPLDLSQFDESIDRPGAYHPALSSRSDELMLYRLFDAQRVWVKPAIVAVVATDVRDRLFLLNEIRKNLPTALPVLMEMDFLMAHPDFRRIMRGSVVIPNGRTLVVLNDADRVVDRCPDPPDDHPRPSCRYLTFPADYAANMFRAVIGLIEQFESYGTIAKSGNSGNQQTLVATLAGFQTVGQEDKGRADAGIFLAANSRIALGKPFYIGLLALACLVLAVSSWLGYSGRKHLAMVSPLRHPEACRGVTERTRTGTHVVLCVLLAVAGFGIFAIAGFGVLAVFELLPKSLGHRTFLLAHGRDHWALAGLAALYTAIAIVGVWRLKLWTQRYRHFRCPGNLADPDHDKDKRQTREGNTWVGFAAAIIVLLVLVASAWLTRGLMHAVDSPWPSFLLSMFLLPAGAWFLGQFRTHAQRWAQCALMLGRTMDVVATKAVMHAGSRDRSWPTPMALGELPQSPLSLQFRARDLELFGWSNYDEVWEKTTCRLMAGEWPFQDGKSPEFKVWQSRLVAEMRYAAVAVRTAAWCGIIAPTIVLIGMQVYPPYDEQLQTIVATGLVILGFVLLMYQALRLERHPLLGCMFTQHGDELSLGGALSAMWPKVIAATVILVPVLFPDFMTWIKGLVQSITSLQ